MVKLANLTIVPGTLARTKFDSSRAELGEGKIERDR